MTRDEYVESIKSAALDIAKRGVMKFLASKAVEFKVSFLMSGFGGWLAGLVVGKVLEIAIKYTEFAAFFLYIDMRVDRQGDEFSKAAHAWYNAPPEEKAKFEKAYLESFYNLASLKS